MLEKYLFFIITNIPIEDERKIIRNLCKVNYSLREIGKKDLIPRLNYSIEPNLKNDILLVKYGSSI